MGKGKALMAAGLFVGAGLLVGNGIPALRERGAEEGSAGPKAVHTFTDQADLDNFKQVIQTKQMILTRIGVLQDYLTREKSNLEGINAQLYLKFKMEPYKQYNLDEEKMSLTEMISEEPSPAPSPELE